MNSPKKVAPAGSHLMQSLEFLVCDVTVTVYLHSAYRPATNLYPASTNQAKVDFPASNIKVY